MAAAPSAPGPRNALLAGAAVVALAAGAAGVAILAGQGGPPREAGPAGAAEALPDLGEVPDFSFTERSGKTVSRRDLAGRTWVADFIFTNCAGVCPAMSHRLAEVHETLRKEPDALCVSFTTDPDRDTLEVLREYADHYKATPDRWLFLRGPQKDVLALQHGGFRIGSATDPFLHSERFALVDARGRIRGFYHGVDPEGVKALLADFRRLRAREGS